MPQVVFTQSFRFSPDGVQVVTFAPGEEPQEVTARCREVALSVEAAHDPEPKEKPQSKPTKPAAPKGAKGKP